MNLFETKVGVLKGVGPKKVSALNKLEINTINDLLTDYPFRYEDLGVKDLQEVQDQQKVALKGVVATAPALVRFGRYRSRLNFNLLVGNDSVRVTFFNQPYLASRLDLGQEAIVYGKFDRSRQSLTGMKIINPQKTNDFAAVYRASKEIKAGTIEKIVKQAYGEYKNDIQDLLPLSLREKYRIIPRRKMIHDMHFPPSKEAASAALRSAIFEEFFLFQAGLQYMKKKQAQHNQGLKIAYDNQKLKAFIATLPFELTDAQKKVVNEICSDLHHSRHMNRLLQGDVGSGKTVVAAIAIYAAITAGFQCALMVPTEILAEQHANKFADLFAPLGVNVALLTGATVKSAPLRRELMQHIKDGDINLVIGTQALIQEGVEFHNLGLVITDEQHRFGVEQRQELRNKGRNPDVLAMTATPIPRTLAITAYGEMDVSIINQLPAGRKPVKTSWFNKKQINSALEVIKDQLSQGVQAYVIAPLIEKSDVMDLQNAEEVYHQLNDYFAPQYKVGLLHGNMTNEEKNQVMADFKDGKIDVLASTTVIEVGVDVPNATVMMILDADRFGLAQLHQLRGRVGRGSKVSYCLLVADPKNDYGKKRMETMVATSNGFVIAQKDLELRGPGDVLGKKQSGIPDFKIGDPVKNLNILQVAQEEAHDIINADDFEQKAENQNLIKYLEYKIDNQGSFD